jgi:hypothetical protein
MSRKTPIAATIVLSTVLLVGGTSLIASAGNNPSSGPAVRTPQPYGVNYTIHTYSDPNFCLDDTVRSDGTPGIMAECAANDNQHWTFAHASDGSIVVIDGLGQCLGLPSKVGGYITLSNCTFSENEHFFYKGNTGQIESQVGKECLQAQAATQDASIQVEKCQSKPPLHTSLQVWQIGH